MVSPILKLIPHDEFEVGKHEPETLLWLSVIERLWLDLIGEPSLQQQAVVDLRISRRHLKEILFDRCGLPNLTAKKIWDQLITRARQVEDRAPWSYRREPMKDAEYTRLDAIVTVAYADYLVAGWTTQNPPNLLRFCKNLGLSHYELRGYLWERHHRGIPPLTHRLDDPRRPGAPIQHRTGPPTTGEGRR